MKLDWAKVTNNLRHAGFSCACVSRKLGCTEATLQKLARGEVCEPKFSTGVALLDLHHKHCNDKHDMETLAK